MAVKGHKKMKEQKHSVPWARKQIVKHTEGKCPHCSKSVNNLEDHIKSKHLSKKKISFQGIIHGHD